MSAIPTFARNRTMNMTINFLRSRVLSRSSLSTDSYTENDELYKDDESFQDQPQPLYPGHIPTTFFQKSLLTIGSSIVALADPYRDDMVAVLGETTGVQAFKRLRKIMLEDAEGAQILRERPRISTSTVNLNYLKNLPEDTFGYKYYRFLADNDVTPDSRKPVRFVDDPDLAYIAQRYRESHDMIHTILGMDINMLGEVTVKWVEAVQTGIPMCAAAGLFGAVRLRPKQRKQYVTRYLPWALKVGYSSKNLMCVYYEKHWEVPHQELQNRLNIPPSPAEVAS